MHTLNQGQLAVMQSATQFLTSSAEHEMVIKGRAGTGKSTLVQELVPLIHKYTKLIEALLKQPNPLPIYLTATTNKAAKVLADITGEETTTIHSLLGLIVKNDYSTGGNTLSRKADSKVIENSVILVDEAFYICPRVLEFIRKGTSNCKIIYIGDPYQCAPIRQTHSPVQDINCRTEELTQVMRNSGALTLLGNHWRESVITGIFSPFTIQDPNIIWATGSEFQDYIDQECKDPNAPETKNKIVTWTNTRSVKYSDYVRQLRGLPKEFSEGEYLQINNSLPKLGFPTDSVIRIKKFESNASVKGIDGRFATTYCGANLFIPNSSADYSFALKKHAADKNWKDFFEIQNNIPDLRSVHGCTVHKAQGSTYDNAFIDLADIGKCNIASDVARIMNVAVTRAKNKVIFRGRLPDKYGG